MANPTVLSITFTCGHQERKDLSHVPAGKRKGKAYGMGKNFVCTACFTAKGKEDLQRHNRDQLASAEVFEEEHQLPELDGSEKQLPWATRNRYAALSAVLEDTDHGDEVLAAATSITKAGWWIDNFTDRDLTVEDYIELITTWEEAHTDEYIETENPH